MTAERAAFDTSAAHHARIADYLLGGRDNFAGNARSRLTVRTLVPGGCDPASGQAGCQRMTSV